MRARGSTIVMLLVSGLMAGSAAGVTAQVDDGAYDPLSSIRAPSGGVGDRASLGYDPLSSIRVPRGGVGGVALLGYDPLSSIQALGVGGGLPAPVEFAGRWQFGEPLVPEASRTVAGITQNRGGVWQAISKGMSDPRLDGTLTSVANMNIYPPASADGPPVFAFNEVIRIENHRGAWQALPHVGFYSPGFSPNDAMTDWTIVMNGEGAYGGLSAIAYLDTQDGWIDVHGVILPTSHPPHPAARAE